MKLTKDELKQIVKDLKNPNLTEERAIYISTTKWWKQINVKMAALLQFQQERLCTPEFNIFKKLIAESIGEKVYTDQLTSKNHSNLINKIYLTLSIDDTKEMYDIDPDFMDLLIITITK